MFEKLRTQLTQVFQRRRDPPRLVVTDAELVLFDGNRESWKFCWNAVNRVVTYKRDLGVVDMICVDFLVGPEKFSTHDRMRDFDVLCKRLVHHFPSIAEDWWFRVAFPAFETNLCVLFERPTA